VAPAPSGAIHPPPRAGAPQGGTAVIEFAMLFPIALMVLLIIVQLALLMQGNLMINYGAYAATRSAVVQVPQDLQYLGEARNFLDPRGAKIERIRRAVVLAVTPISGRVTPSAEALAIQADLRGLYARAGEQPRAGLGQAFAQKFTYADQHTFVDADEVGPPQGTNDEFTPSQPVRVVIRHDLELGVPFARAIFADGSFRDADGNTHYTTTVEAYYQLTNEGPRTEPLEPYCPLPPPAPPEPQPPSHPYHPPGFGP
jgi:hypothetical protein